MPVKPVVAREALAAAREECEMRIDAQIQQAVLRELKWDTRVAETDVGVEVDRGVVTLTGNVDSYAKRVAAQEAAHRVVGVLDVANDVQVKIPGAHARTDTEIAQAARRALEWNVTVPDERIQTTVADGRISLTGDVDTWHQREDAEHAVRYLPGVRGVSNTIVVNVLPVAPAKVREEIEEALERRAEREAKRIQVSVHDGMVTLSGTVRTWPEKRAVIGAARFTPGVYAVEDHLRIDPST
jgi:osmotically-inducible protein OsmY